MEKNSPKRALALLGLIAVLAVIGLFAIIRTITLPDENTSAEGRGDQISHEFPENAGSELTPRNERTVALPLEYRSDADSSAVKIALDEIALIDADGKSSIVTLDPPATAQTLGLRMRDFSASQGVLPVAYAEDSERNETTRRLVTSKIRAKLPPEQAERVAKKHGLQISERPSYAPEWVIFSADQPLEALEKISELRGEDFVESADVLLASSMAKKALPNDTQINNQWHLRASGAALAGTDVNIEGTWQYGIAGDERRGQGILIGIVDDGLETAHPDLAPNVNTALDFDWNGNDNDPNPGPGDRHGTACAGLAGAKGNNSLGVAGTAPASTLVGMRLIGGPATDQMIAQAMSFRLSEIPVKSNSFGPEDLGTTLVAPEPLTLAAFKNAAETGRGGKGVIFVWAGGNGGRTSVKDNSNYDGFANSIYTIAIGATNSNGGRADYAEPGANLIVSAPSSGAGGLGIVTTDLTDISGYNGSTSAAGGDYTSVFGGTSAATPEVAGIVALMLKENPNLSWRDVQEILIRSAKKVLPSDPDWSDNAAGYHFNHNFGAGLVDATAAVNMASPSTWVTLGTHTNVVSTLSDPNATIPNNSATGITRQFSLPTSNLRIEHVTLRLSINHQARGELEISLTSPSGMVSRLAEVRPDPNANYSNWTFSSARNWGELSSGTWTLKIADRSNTNSSPGTLTFAQLTVFGASAAPINPAPVVSITSPSTGSLSSPGVAVPVEVSAVDFDVNGDPSTVSKVELFANNVLVGTDTVAPYSFTHSPPLGNVTYVARATDIASKFADSAPVVVTVVNQTPSISAINQNSTGQLYADTQLQVTSVSVNDPEGEPITLTYQWQSSIDETTFTNLAGAVGPTLPVSPSNAGKIWRCRITATDGNTTSAASFSAPINITLRPADFAAPGAAYSYQSGLVLRGVETIVTRQAIIHEFSHGNNGSNSQWAEILVMKTGSFRNWRLRDSSGNAIFFQNTSVWDAIPAGTLIVIYNGTSGVPKNSLLPADTTDTSTGRMVLSSANATYFSSPTSSWPLFGSSGGSLFLTNGPSTIVHSLSYGNAIDASPNIGTVSAGNAAFYFGDSDAGADDPRNWLKTGSNTARSIPVTPAADFTEKSLSSLVTLTGGRYAQNFNSIPGPSGTSYPNGWTSFNQPGIVLPDDVMTVGNGSETTTGNFNYVSQIGIRGATPNSFDPGYIVVGLANTNGLTSLKISYDIIKIDEQGRNMEFTLQYTPINPDSSTTSWFDISGGGYNSGTSPNGTRTRYENVVLPAIFENRSSPIYLRWLYRTASGSGSGAGDALALDNVLISSAQSPNILLGLSLAPSSVSEVSGTSASLATLTLSQASATNLTFQLTSSDPFSASVPASLLVPAGQLSATFPISTINNEIPDGTRAVTISAAAPGFATVSKILTVTDDEAPVNGVTPGAPNSGPNTLFVNRLRNNQLIDAPLYSLASGSTLPTGLALNPNTGVIAGTISSSAPLGTYPITVNLTNIIGGITSQTFTITLTASGNPNFDAWVTSFSVANSASNADPDLDLLPNLIEYKLNTLPGVIDLPSPIQLESSPSEISLTYSRAKNRDDVTLIPEWNTSLDSAGWQTSDITETILGNFADSQRVKSSLPVSPGNPKRFLRLRATKVTPP